MTRAGKMTFATAIALVAGCNLILGNEPGKPYVEGGTPEAATDVAQDAPHTCDGAAPDDAATMMCPGGVWYVSATQGNDAFSGCSPCAPKASIQSALDAIDVVQPDAGTVAVHVCAGTYPEVGLTVHRPLSLEGGWDCTSWTRPSDYGYPTFGTTTTTSIVNGNPLSDDATMHVTTGAIAGTLIDGFSIAGASVTSNATSAISIDGDAAPAISNCKIAGGTGHDPGSWLGSIGISIQGTGSPDITSDDIDGGSGNSVGSTGSAGVALLFGSGFPHIHKNRIAGGAGSGAYGSAGVFVSSTDGALTHANNAAIENNIVHGGSGTGDVEGSSGVFLFASTAAIEMSGNTIDAGTGSATGNDLNVGVYAFGASSVTLTQNRVAGGGTLTPSNSASTGVYLANTTALLVNNFIHGGYSANNTDGVVVGASTAVLLYNTILAGAAGNPISPAIYAGSGNVTIRGNLLVGYAAAGAPAIYEPKTCGDNVVDAITDLTDNAIINTGGGVLGYQSCGSTATVAATEGYLNALPDAPTTASGNVILLETCSEARCVVTTGCTLAPGSDAACLANVFSSYTASDVGQTELFGAGYLLKATAHCEVTKGGETQNTNAPADFFGTARTNRLSIGAVEQDGAGCVP